MNIDGSDDIFYRYKMPKVDVKYEKSCTVLYNLHKIAKSICRDASYLQKYLDLVLCTGSKYDDRDNRCIFRGTHDIDVIQNAIISFNKQFVLCQLCSNPETQFLNSRPTKKNKLKIKCNACGHSSKLHEDKMTSFITKKNIHHEVSH